MNAECKNGERAIQFFHNVVLYQQIRYFLNEMQTKLQNYLKSKGIIINEGIAQTIIATLVQGQKQIQSLSQQITRYKCQQLKNQKIIKTLQQKLNQLTPSICDTSSTFMMASQFKSNFDEFMTSSLPNSFGQIMDRPYLFKKIYDQLSRFMYEHVNSKVQSIILQIYNCLGIDKEINKKEQILTKIKTNLIKILQEQWEYIFPYPNQYKIRFAYNENIQDIINEINQLMERSQAIELLNNLHKLCVYMVLQQKKWEFQHNQQKQVDIYNKKQHVCIDGWIKEGASALVILPGIKKDGQFHANLKNYVIPYIEQESPQMYSCIELLKYLNSTQKLLNKKQIKQQIILNERKQNMGIRKNQFNLKIQSQVANKNLFSLDQSQNKQNISHMLNKKQKKKQKQKQKQKNQLQVSIKHINDLKSPTNRSRNSQSNIKRKKSQSKTLKDLPQDRNIFQQNNKKKSLVLRNIDSETIEDDKLIMILKRKNNDDMPMNKENPLKKKIKNTQNRKESVGKIVSQHQIINFTQQKQNDIHFLNIKQKNKQKIYKQIIKQRLQDEKIDKCQNSLTLLQQKYTTDKRKDQNRPLKIISNAAKLREKYIN